MVMKNILTPLVGSAKPDAAHATNASIPCGDTAVHHVPSEKSNAAK
jgi:hypothetical protein